MRVTFETNTLKEGNLEIILDVLKCLIDTNVEVVFMINSDGVKNWDGDVTKLNK